jgi:hypothetical protein
MRSAEVTCPGKPLRRQSHARRATRTWQALLAQTLDEVAGPASARSGKMRARAPGSAAGTLPFASGRPAATVTGVPAPWPSVSSIALA